VNLINTTNTISSEALVYAPLALNAVQGIEAAAAATPGETKSQIAINIVLAAAQTAAGVPIPTVAAVGSLVSLIVGILNFTGVFSHKAKPQAPPPPVNPAALGSAELSRSFSGASAQLTGAGQGPGAAASTVAQGYGQQTAGQQTAPPFGTQPAALVIPQPVT
jgi:hypothetical protein